MNQSAGAQSMALPLTPQEIPVVSTMQRPLWVTIGLWGLATRSVAFSFVVISILCAVGSIAYWTWWGALLFLSALWYWLAIRWVDQNDSW
jgi:hypothetical protein